MRKLIIWILLLAITGFGSAWARVIYVPADYPSIQGGIYASNDDDTVLVAPGLYAEHISFLGRNIVVKSESGPDSTILQRLRSYEPIVSIVSNEGNTAVFEGFTVRNSTHAPGIMIENSRPRIIGNIFKNNSNDEHGGAIMSMFGYPFITENYFEDNISTMLGGGAIFVYQGDGVISHNTFYHNRAPEHHGGGIHIFQSEKSIVHHNLFYQNSCLSLGGAFVFSVCTHGLAYNNTVVENSDIEAHGAGITVWYSDSCHVYNNIIVQNNGIGLYSYPVNNSVAEYNDVWTNTINYQGIDPQEGSISVNPEFIGGDPFSFHLNSTSPCIDAGDPASSMDPDGTIADLGAFYYDQETGIDDEPTPIPSGFTLSQNYPNPFNASTSIEFSLPSASQVSLAVYDCSGRKICILAEGAYETGIHRMVWNGTSDDGSAVGSGIYFYKLRCGGQTISKNMLLLK